MPFNPRNYLLTNFLVKDLPPAQAVPIGVFGGILGSNPLAPVLLAVAAHEGRAGTGTAGPPPAAGTAAPAKVQVPELPDDPEEAKEVVAGHGLLAAVAEVASGEPLGGVIGSEPEAGTVVPGGSTVTILVSAGLAVPDVVGRECEEAEAALRAAGFEEVEVAESEKSGAETVVASQDPKAGSFADARSSSTLYVFRPKPRLSAARSSRGG